LTGKILCPRVFLKDARSGGFIVYDLEGRRGMSRQKLRLSPDLIAVLTVCMLTIFLPQRAQSRDAASAAKKKEVKQEMNVEVKPFGEIPGGQKVDLYTLTNSSGLKAEIMTYGGIVMSLQVPDRGGKTDDIVLGYNNLDDYIKNNPYFGAIVGRYGNRIGKGRFTLDGVQYTLAANNGENHLHGGIKGFDKVVWKAEPIKQWDGVGVKLMYLSKDGEEGYPGNLNCTVTYTLRERNELKVEYLATTDKPTVVNLTHHGYFNLTGCQRDILAHELMLNADRFTPVDAGLIPTGQLLPVKGTVMDFTRPTPIGARIANDYEQLKFGGGYDHNWAVNGGGRSLTLAARVYEPTTGRVMEVLTTEPGIQFYCGNFLDGTITGKNGIVYKHRYGFCLETQHYPDSPNKPDFPSTVLRPGEKYETTTIYRFSTRKAARM
jgi:aldose 1-epimerase